MGDQRNSNFEDEKITIFSENLFNKKVQDVVHPFFGTIPSHFSDEDAREICLKARKGKIRKFARLSFEKNLDVDQDLLWYYIHKFANDLLNLYGGNIVTFLFKLEKWPSDQKGVKILKNDIGNSFSTNLNSSMVPRLIIESLDGSISYSMTFSTILEKHLGNYVPATIKNQISSKKIKVSIDGKLLEDFENCIPEVAIFKALVGGQVKLYCGYDDDVCDICGRPLEDIVSIKYGRGPICRRDYGLPKGTNPS